MFGASKKEINKLDEMINEFRGMKEEFRSIKETLESHNRRFHDFEDRIRNIEYAMRESFSAESGRPAEPRYGYRGKALIERPEDRDELGLFF